MNRVLDSEGSSLLVNVVGKESGPLSWLAFLSLNLLIFYGSNLS